MLALSLHFTAGRYCATPWGHHVNEGAVEWPPSPWRLLRALVSAWKTTLPDVSDAQMIDLLGKLAAPPRFHLPESASAHTRHYMPLADGRKKTLVFDAAVTVDRASPVIILWPDLELGEAEHALLSVLVRRVPYLGRAESWCLLDLLPPGARVPPHNSVPLDVGSSAHAVLDTVSLLAPTVPLDLASLCVRTPDLRAAGQNIHTPPGARWLTYTRPIPSRPAGGRVGRSLTTAFVSVARYKLVAKPLPSVTRTIQVAEAARRTLMGIYGKQNGRAPSRAFSGKDAAGAPLQGHRHAFYVSTDEDGDSHIDHLTVCVPTSEGFDAGEQQALDALTELRLGDSVPGGAHQSLDDESCVAVTLLALGNTHDPASLSARGQVPLFSSAQRWRSVTPFVLSRHPKQYSYGAHRPRMADNGYQLDGPEDQLLRELRLRGLPQPRIMPLARHTAGGHSMSWQEFRRWRSSKRSPAPAEARGWGFELEFPTAVSGPLALGYGAHFGLGLFLPCDEQGCD